MKKYRIHFLSHSGFVLETADRLLVFDYDADPTDVLGKLLNETEKRLYFFVSHIHRDHFNPGISQFENRCSGYFMHADCHLNVNSKNLLHPMKVGDSEEWDGMKIHMYGSTDAGGSFWIECSGLSMFHAGDLNWWHWAGEKDEDNAAARLLFFNELEKIKEHKVDILFFPVDERQQVAREWGVKAILHHIKAELLVPMHAFGRTWVPSYEFRWNFREQKIWIPRKNGDVWEGV